MGAFEKKIRSRYCLLILCLSRVILLKLPDRGIKNKMPRYQIDPEPIDAVPNQAPTSSLLARYTNMVQDAAPYNDPLRRPML
jgi:hypothetical protein